MPGNFFPEWNALAKIYQIFSRISEDLKAKWFDKWLTGIKVADEEYQHQYIIMMHVWW